MNRVLSVLLLFLAIYPCAGSAQSSMDNLIRDFENQRKNSEIQIEQARLKMKQLEAESTRMRTEEVLMRAQSERTQAQIDEFFRERERARDARRAEEVAAKLEQEMKKAQEVADDLQTQLELSAVRSKNNFYLSGLTVLFFAFALLVYKLKRRGVAMNEGEKFGLLLTIVSFLLAVLFVMISRDWYAQFDFFTNLMASMRIKLIESETIPGDFLIDFPTKYWVFGCLVSAAYGVTTFLGIAPTPFRRKNVGQHESPPSRS